MSDRMEILLGDITQQRVDAVVNAAHSSLLGGGRVDAAIHEAAGPELLEECRSLQGCEIGEAKITPGFKLPAPWVIHTVGPEWNGGQEGEDDLLAQCYRSCLTLAREYDIRTIAFPAVGTGADGFPMDRAARIALDTTATFLENGPSIEKVLLVTFTEEAYEVYRAVYRQLFGTPPGEKPHE